MSFGLEGTPALSPLKQLLQIIVASCQQNQLLFGCLEQAVSAMCTLNEFDLQYQVFELRTDLVAAVIDIKRQYTVASSVYSYGREQERVDETVQARFQMWHTLDSTSKTDQSPAIDYQNASHISSAKTFQSTISNPQNTVFSLDSTSDTNRASATSSKDTSLSAASTTSSSLATTMVPHSTNSGYPRSDTTFLPFPASSNTFLPFPIFGLDSTSDTNRASATSSQDTSLSTDSTTSSSLASTMVPHSNNSGYPRSDTTFLPFPATSNTDSTSDTNRASATSSPDTSLSTDSTTSSSLASTMVPHSNNSGYPRSDTTFLPFPATSNTFLPFPPTNNTFQSSHSNVDNTALSTAIPNSVMSMRVPTSDTFLPSHFPDGNTFLPSSSVLENERFDPNTFLPSSSVLADERFDPTAVTTVSSTPGTIQTARLPSHPHRLVTPRKTRIISPKDKRIRSIAALEYAQLKRTIFSAERIRSTPPESACPYSKIFVAKLESLGPVLAASLFTHLKSDAGLDELHQTCFLYYSRLKHSKTTSAGRRVSYEMLANVSADVPVEIFYDAADQPWVRLPATTQASRKRYYDNKQNPFRWHWSAKCLRITAAA
ncbi:hypothetical protein A4X13_0g4416 [Tilletia indica]|uniref:Uncharacterized protein n=1 Tax=Tilletia indica TaxID=43049 RepID=A0A8T8SZ60_9BASI|nr:hypothetical protein A4X13_0g4416 [Tilletia indica]